MPQIRYPTTSPASVLALNNNNSEYTPLPTNFNPGPNDVVCGRGPGYYNCQGNVQFRTTVKQFVKYYLKQPNKSSKTAALEEIVQHCKRHDGAKFVKQLQGDWVELSDLSAREKVGNAMFEAISARNVRLQQQQTQQQAFAQQQALVTQQQSQQQLERQQHAWQHTTVRKPQEQQQQQPSLQGRGRHPGMPAPQPKAKFVKQWQGSWMELSDNNKNESLCNSRNKRPKTNGNDKPKKHDSTSDPVLKSWLEKDVFKGNVPHAVCQTYAQELVDLGVDSLLILLEMLPLDYLDENDFSFMKPFHKKLLKTAIEQERVNGGKNETLTQERNRHRQALCEKEKELEALREEKRSLEDRLKDQQSKIKVLQERLENCESEFDVLFQDSIKDTDTIATLRSEKEALLEQLSKAKTFSGGGKRSSMRQKKRKAEQ